MITGQSVIDDLKSLVYREVAKNYPEPVALACTNALIQCLYLNFKNQLMYIPTATKDDIKKKHDLIYNEFKGNNHKDLAVKFRLSLQSIYKIVDQKRRKHISDIQSDLFPLPKEINITPVTYLVIQEYLPAEFLKCNISDIYTKQLVDNISKYLQDNYPGISICISKKMSSNINIDTIFN